MPLSRTWTRNAQTGPARHVPPRPPKRTTQLLALPPSRCGPFWCTQVPYGTRHHTFRRPRPATVARCIQYKILIGRIPNTLRAHEQNLALQCRRPCQMITRLPLNEVFLFGRVAFGDFEINVFSLYSTLPNNATFPYPFVDIFEKSMSR